MTQVVNNAFELQGFVCWRTDGTFRTIVWHSLSNGGKDWAVTSP